jgi:DNA primase
MIPKDTVDQIYASIDIVDVVGDYVSLKKRGSNWWGLSPFKPEKTPSFSVSAAKGIFKCFSTGKGGNAVNFVMEMEGLTYLEALLHLARKYNIPIETQAPTPAALAQQHQRDSLKALANYALNWFQDTLHQTPDGTTIALPYFRERGFSDETLRVFQVGFNPPDWAAFSEAALKNQFRKEILVESGLSIQSEKTSNLIDRFRGRVIFPICDASGQPIGFAGRIMGQATDTAKYINSPESALYHKSKALFGLHLARTAIRQLDRCIVVEGYTDVMSLHQAGVKEVVATCGTALTVDQVTIVKRLTANVISLYDGDLAGVRASVRAIELFVAQGLAPCVLNLPPEHDPDSFVRLHGADHFRTYLADHAVDFIDFINNAAHSTASDGRLPPQKRIELIEQLARIIVQVPDLVRREVFAQQAAFVLKIDVTAFGRALQAAQAQLEKERRVPRSVAAISPTPAAQTAASGSSGTAFLPASPQEPELSAHPQEFELMRLWLQNGHKPVTIETPDNSYEGTVHGYLTHMLANVEFRHPHLEWLRVAACDILPQPPKPQPAPEEPEQPSLFPIDFWLGYAPALRGTLSALLAAPYELSENWLKHDRLIKPQDTDLAACLENALLHYQRVILERLYQETLQALRSAPLEEQPALLEQIKYINEGRKKPFSRLGVIVTSGR